MALSVEHLLTLSTLEGLGQITLSALQDYSIRNNITIQSLRELHALYNKGQHLKLFRNSTRYTPFQLVMANSEAKRILEQSHALNIQWIAKQEYPLSLQSFSYRGRLATPPFLFYKGDLTNITRQKRITLTGTKYPTPEGVRTARYISSFLTQQGIAVVSGTNIGCDTAVHQGATPGLHTAIAPHGLDYEIDSTLGRDILNNGGLLLSASPLGMRSQRQSWIEQAQMMGAFTDGVVIIQSEQVIQPLISTAFENHKPIWAVEYKDLDKAPRVQGNRELIQKMFARPLTSATLQQLTNLLFCK